MLLAAQRVDLGDMHTDGKKHVVPDIQAEASRPGHDLDRYLPALFPM